MNANRLCPVVLAGALACLAVGATWAQTPSPLPPTIIQSRPTPEPPPGPPSPETLQVAVELTSLVSAATTGDAQARAIAQAWPPMESALRAQNARIDAPTLAELRHEFERLVLASFGELQKDAPAIYARNFTADEMREVIAFYRTPAGAKALRVMPRVSAEMLAQLAPRIQGLQEKVTLAFLNILQRKGLYAR